MSKITALAYALVLHSKICECSLRVISIALGIDVAICCVCLAAFSLLRLGGWTAKFYQPNRFTPRFHGRQVLQAAGRRAEPRTQTVAQHQPRQRPRPVPLPRAPFLWLLPLLRLPEREVLRCCGLDVLVYLRLLRFGSRLSLILAVVCCSIVLPTNITGAYIEELISEDSQPEAIVISPGPIGEPIYNATGLSEGVASPPFQDSPAAFFYTDFDRVSMSNIPPGSPRLWVHMCCMLVITAATLWLLWRETRSVAALRIAHTAHLLGDALGPPTAESLHPPPPTASHPQPPSTPPSQYALSQQHAQQQECSNSVQNGQMNGVGAPPQRLNLEDQETAGHHHHPQDLCLIEHGSWNPPPPPPPPMPGPPLKVTPKPPTLPAPPQAPACTTPGSLEPAPLAFKCLQIALCPPPPHQLISSSSATKDHTISIPSPLMLQTPQTPLPPPPLQSSPHPLPPPPSPLLPSPTPHQHALPCQVKPPADPCTVPASAVLARTVLVTDIPGTSVGTIVPAIHDLLLSSPILKILPRPWRMALDWRMRRMMGRALLGIGAVAAQAVQAWIPKGAQPSQATPEVVHGHGQEPRARTKEAGAMTQGVAPSEIVCADRGSSRGGSRRGGQARAPTNGVHGSRPSTSTPAGAAGSSASVGIWDEQGSALPTAAMDARPGPWRSTVLVEAAVSADRVDGDGVWRGEQRGAHALSARCDESNDGKEGAIEAYPISEPGTGRRESSSYKDFGSVDEATRAVGCGTYSSCGGGSSDARPHGPGDGWGWEAGQDVGAVLAGSGRPHGAEQRLSSWARAVESIMRCGSYPEMVLDEMKKVYGNDEVVGLVVPRSTLWMSSSIRDYQKAQAALEDLLEDYSSCIAQGLPVKRKQVRVVPRLLGRWATDKYGKSPVKVDSLTFRTDALRAAKDVLETSRHSSHRHAHLAGMNRGLDGTDIYVPAALVTFRTHFTAAVASSGLHSHDADAWLVWPAPEPAEILWASLRLRGWQRRVHRRVMWAGFWTVVLLYVVPVSALQALLQVQRMDRIPVLQDIVAVPFIRSVLTGLLPGLVLRILLLVMPMILAALVRRSGVRRSRGDVDAAVMTMYFIFQVATVFLSSFVAGTLLYQLGQFIERPPSVLNLLGTGLPQTTSFFFLYIIFNAFVVKPLALLRLFSLIMFIIRYPTAGTVSARRRLWAQQQQPLGPLVPDHCLVLLLGLVFSVLNPIVAPACTAYFGVVRILEKYQHVYVWQRQYESGGRLWKRVVAQVLVGLYFAQATLLALLAVKRFRYTPVLLLAPLATILVHRSMSQQLLGRPWSVSSLREARDLDEVAREANAASRAPPVAPLAQLAGPTAAVGAAVAATDQTLKAASWCWGQTAAHFNPPDLDVGSDALHYSLLGEVETLEAVMSMGSAFLNPLYQARQAGS